MFSEVKKMENFIQVALASYRSASQNIIKDLVYPQKVVGHLNLFILKLVNLKKLPLSEKNSLNLVMASVISKAVLALPISDGVELGKQFML